MWRRYTNWKMENQHVDLRHGKLFFAAGLKKAAADTEACVVDENIQPLVVLYFPT